MQKLYEKMRENGTNTTMMFDFGIPLVVDAIKKAILNPELIGTHLIMALLAPLKNFHIELRNNNVYLYSSPYIDYDTQETHDVLYSEICSIHEQLEELGLKYTETGHDNDTCWGRVELA